MNAHAAIFQALFERTRRGRGRGIEVSLFDGISDWMAVPLLHHDYGGKAPSRVGLNHPSIAPCDMFATADGKAVVISIQNEREWRTLCTQVLDRADLAEYPRFASNARRIEHRPALDGAVAVSDLSDHAQLRRLTIDSPTGPVAIPAPPVRWDDELCNAGPVPAIDSHGAAIREEFA